MVKAFGDFSRLTLIFLHFGSGTYNVGQPEVASRATRNWLPFAKTTLLTLWLA